MAFDNSDSIIWHLIAGTKGGPNRLQILFVLMEKPYNANQLAKETGLDYKTIKHHLEILIENGMIRIAQAKNYGELYHLTDFAKQRMNVFKNIWKKLEGEDFGK